MPKTKYPEFFHPRVLIFKTGCPQTFGVLFFKISRQVRTFLLSDIFKVSHLFFLWACWAFAECLQRSSIQVFFLNLSLRKKKKQCFEGQTFLRTSQAVLPGKSQQQQQQQLRQRKTENFLSSAVATAAAPPHPAQPCPGLPAFFCGAPILPNFCSPLQRNPRPSDQRTLAKSGNKETDRRGRIKWLGKGCGQVRGGGGRIEMAD